MRDDAELVVAARSGDPDALGDIYDRYTDRIHDFCLSVLRNRDDAAEAMRDTFVIAAAEPGRAHRGCRCRGRGRAGRSRGR
jgi:DNA-directed RNA polymerase specialized sigma24 family protein